MSDKNIISWVGGKRLLRKTIAPLIPDDITAYIEPFGGAGWVMFYKPRWANLEVYNDLDSRLVNMFRCVKYHPEELKRELAYMPHSREIFDKLKHHDGLTDIQRAARFIYLLNRSFGGKGETYGRSLKTPSGKSPDSIIELITEINQRLSRVRIEHQDFEVVLTDYDRQGAFFYCDPPYSAGQGYITATTAGFEHERLRECLGGVKSRWLLSYDDSPKIRELYRGYQILEITRDNSLNKKHSKNATYRELIIANYPIK